MPYCTLQEAFHVKSFDENLDVDTPQPVKAQTNEVPEYYMRQAMDGSEGNNLQKEYQADYNMQAQRESAENNHIDQNPYKHNGAQYNDYEDVNLVKRATYNPRRRRRYPHPQQRREGFHSYHMSDMAGPTDGDFWRYEREWDADYYNPDLAHAHRVYQNTQDPRDRYSPASRPPRSRIYSQYNTQPVREGFSASYDPMGYGPNCGGVLEHIRNCKECQKAATKICSSQSHETTKSLIAPEITEIFTFILIGIFLIFAFNGLTRLIR